MRKPRFHYKAMSLPVLDSLCKAKAYAMKQASLGNKEQAQRVSLWAAGYANSLTKALYCVITYNNTRDFEGYNAAAASYLDNVNKAMAAASIPLAANNTAPSQDITGNDLAKAFISVRNAMFAALRAARKQKRVLPQTQRNKIRRRAKNALEVIRAVFARCLATGAVTPESAKDLSSAMKELQGAARMPYSKAL